VALDTTAVPGPRPRKTTDTYVHDAWNRLVRVHREDDATQTDGDIAYYASFDDRDRPRPHARVAASPHH